MVQCNMVFRKFLESIQCEGDGITLADGLLKNSLIGYILEVDLEYPKA